MFILYRLRGWSGTVGWQLWERTSHVGDGASFVEGSRRRKPAIAPALRPLEEVDDVDVPETAPAVGVEEAEDELEETPLLPLFLADVAAEPELEAVAELWEELVAIAIVDVSRRARQRDEAAVLCERLVCAGVHL
jgi:hypothetical protein